MKICHFICSKGLGRGEFYIDLVNELSLNEELELTLIIPKEAKFLKRVSKNVKVIEYKSTDSRNNPFLYLELFKIYKENNFDIVHTHFAKASEVFYRLNKVLKATHVATKHNPRKGKIFNKINNVTAVSNDVVESISNKSRVKLIYNGINPIKLPKRKEKNDIFTICTIGRLEKVKGYDILIENIAKLKNDFILNIIGDGKEYDNLVSLIKKFNLENKVKLLGYKENIPEVLNESDLCLISSLSEGFSLVALEALFYSKVLVSTEVGICKVILNDKFLIKDFDFSNKIEDIINNYEVYNNEFNEIKINNKSKFLLSNIANEYVGYYKEAKKKGIK